MTVTLKSKSFGWTLKLENVEKIVPDVEGVLGDKGYKICHVDGGFNLFSYDCFELIAADE